jgi:hypothetical protein
VSEHGWTEDGSAPGPCRCYIPRPCLYDCCCERCGGILLNDDAEYDDPRDVGADPPTPASTKAAKEQLR